MRVKAVIAYDGASFGGFQKQRDREDTVTSKIEEALISIGINSPIRGSGRTDANVHATGQVIDFEIPNFWQDLDRLKDVVNRKLVSIYFKKISAVSDSFHARFSAKIRVYRYIFKSSRVSIFEQRYISYYAPFDTKLLQKSLKIFEGEHDFTNFLKTGSPTHSNIRTIYRAFHREYKDYHIIYFYANGFLRSQVRMMIDFAMRVAQEELTINRQIEQLEVKRRYSTKLAPPEGLYLARVIY